MIHLLMRSLIETGSPLILSAACRTHQSQPKIPEVTRDSASSVTGGEEDIDHLADRDEGNKIATRRSGLG